MNKGLKALAGGVVALVPMIASAANAGEMTLSDLQRFCTAGDDADRNACRFFSLFRISSGCTAGSSAGASPAKRTLDACRGSKLMQGWLRQNAAISPARLSEL
jgi:hypothetical protein